MSERIPVLNDATDYGLWKKQVNIWVLGTQAQAAQQAARLIGFMSGKAHEAAIQIPPEELGTVAKLTTELDKLFLKDDTQSLFQAIEEFEQYNRSKEDSIDEYIRGFEQRYKRLKALRKDKEAYEDGIKAFKLLHQASLTSEQKRLIRATTETLTYDGMVKALKRTFGDGSGIISSSSNDQGKSTNPYFSAASSSGIKIKEEPVFYTKDSYHSSSSASDRSGYCSSGSDKRNQHSSTSDGEKDDEENVLYFQGGKYRRQRPAEHSYQRPNSSEQNFQRQRSSDQSYQRPNSSEQQFQGQRPTGQSYQRQSPNYYQQQHLIKKAENFKKTTCLICDSPEHRVIGCPYNKFTPERKKEDDSKRLTFLTKVVQLESAIAHPERAERCTFLLEETVNKALLDTGASSTVCGKQWLKIYEESLSPEEAIMIKTEPCDTTFRFGDGKKVTSTQLVTLPVQMFGRNFTLETYVVNSEIPLLLSRQMMNDFRFVIDMRQKKVYAMGGEEPILDTTSGHLVVSINGRAFIRVNPCRIVQNEQSSQTDDVPEKEQRPHPKAKTRDSHESEGEKRIPTKTATWFYETVYYSEEEEEEDSTSTSAINDEVDTAVRQEETTPLPQEATPSVEVEETTPQEVTPPVEIEEETQPKWTSKEQPKGKKNAVILKKGDVIRFKDGDNEEWKCGLIDSRAGKATGTHKNSYNVHVDGEDEAQVIDLTDKRVERLPFTEEDKLTVTKEVPKQVPKKVPPLKIRKK